MFVHADPEFINTMTTTPNQIEDFRNKLRTQQVSDFFDTIKNAQEPDAESESLKLLAGKVIARMSEIQQEKIKEMCSSEEICPGCLISATVDLTSIKAMADAYNKLVTNTECANEEEGP